MLTSCDRTLDDVAARVATAAAADTSDDTRRHAWAAMDLALRLLADENSTTTQRRRAADYVERIHQLLAAAATPCPG